MKFNIVERVIGTAVLALAGWQIGSLVGSGAVQPRDSLLGIVVGALIGLALAPWIIGVPHRSLQRAVRQASAQDLTLAVIGLILGLLVAALLAYPLSFLPWWFGHLVPAATAAVCAYLGVSLILLRRAELAQLLPHGGTGRESVATRSGSNGYLIDTSAIIDGRIADISETGFLLGPLLVPRFVLRELQNIAGSSDSLRRARGRRGLEILHQLQKAPATTVTVCDIDAPEVAEVDGKLVKLARELSCPVVTNDFNLNRVAELQGVRVLNINQLANAVKPLVLPGEEMRVRIIQEGKELHQGVGYLDDGTMIVVENGRRHLDSDIAVEVTRVLQTVAGRMIFAQPKSSGNGRE